jgi:hypothetical protein
MTTEHTEDWNEFDWEQSLRESDAYASRYFTLLKRFCDLPGGNELIAQHMGPEFKDLLPDCDYDCESCEHRWDCDFASAPEWSCDDCQDCPDWDECQGSWAQGEDADGEFADGERQEDGQPADEDAQALFYETHPTFRTLRQAAIGWCNIYAAILPPESRPLGLKILFYMGRALANLAYSIDDGSYAKPQASIAFAKRSLAQLNYAIGQLNQLMSERVRLRRVLETIRTHLLQGREGLLDHLQRCRSQDAGSN